MFIKNLSQLLPKDLLKTNLELRKIGLECVERALTAVRPEILLEKSVKLDDDKLIIQNDIFRLNSFRNIYIIGGGKASAQLSFSLEKKLKSANYSNYEGIINVPETLGIEKSDMTGKIKINFASHPIPNESGLNGTKLMMKLIENTHKNDLVVCLLSGGGSALLPLPKKGITLKDKQAINSLLLASGASIHEINTIRKHLSDFKGGNLAKKLYRLSKATMISLIISDVVGNDLNTIASGPTVPDSTTFKEAVAILKKYDLLEKVPLSVKEALNEGLIRKELETPKPNDSCFRNVYNYLLGSVNSAAQEISFYLQQQGFEVNYFSDKIVGEAKEFGKELYQIMTQKAEKIFETKKSDKIALIGTGELSVTINGKGIGGRNQDMLLSFLDFVKNREIRTTFLILGTNLDGIEGNSKAMGALVDNYSLNQAMKEKLDTKKFLENNDSNSFFKILASEIITGSTGCNVNDLVLILILK